MILYIKHIDIEGPETLGDFFAAKGFDSLTVEMGLNEQDLPQSFDNIDAVIGCGGPMNVYEEEKHPFLKQENIFLQKVITQNIPYLGLCLGAQLLTKAGGGSVRKSPEKEIGWYNVELTDAGKQDSLFKGLAGQFAVFQWHEDMFDIPKEASLLASSPKCPYQAFRLGQRAYGLQFHVEVTRASIKEWYQGYLPQDPQAGKRALELYDQKQKSFVSTAETIYENFLTIMNQS